MSGKTDESRPMTIYRARSKGAGRVAPAPCSPPWYARRFGLTGYTVLWTLVFWMAGDAWAALPGFFVAYPIAQGVQATVDWLRQKIFS